MSRRRFLYPYHHAYSIYVLRSLTVEMRVKERCVIVQERMSTVIAAATTGARTRSERYKTRISMFSSRLVCSYTRTVLAGRSYPSLDMPYPEMPSKPD